ncbi:hypothetical protein GCM10010508_56990 [Streptomyces naganishii JCM 4654]|uniref:Uncharacterized protein n=1 Tax=Streptomyces naganishii JCM 4654 TaxID=1306179 RepID=A0A919CYD5_9ACTN|nr:hypothetical protein GCM10010508_56990 [Streptomyces naganishii JCM 4654]
MPGAHAVSGAARRARGRASDQGTRAPERTLWARDVALHPETYSGLWTQRRIKRRTPGRRRNAVQGGACRAGGRRGGALPGPGGAPGRAAHPVSEGARPAGETVSRVPGPAP